MRSPSLALLIVCITLTVPQGSTEFPKCEVHQMLRVIPCIAMVNELNDYIEEHKFDKLNMEVVHNMTVLCDETKKDLSKKREAFEKGESCFFDYIKDHCNKTSIEFFSKNYQKFVTDISIKPDGMNCQSTHNQLNTFQCM
ncbi:hypothetical protein B9Z55_020651 [Caenorhabditis nigoni]|uniref:T20D4.11-like domain-containing protein n=1 Tax=Caenorhabditis nigoni TaxID=1611254 RepID=A0A2G5TNQ2_9PELO|nr:hypothetical protein B9Z55_020651 [Caenorhabditis nigoni]